MRCGECKYWQAIDSKVLSGTCSRYPPVLDVSVIAAEYRFDEKDFEVRTCKDYWAKPITDVDDFCGEFI